MTTSAAADLSFSKRFVMMTAGIPTTFCLTAVVPILPKMEAALADGPTEQLLVKMVVAVTGVSMMLGAPLAGWIVDKTGRAPLLFWSLLLWAPLGVCGYFIDNLWLMVGTRVLLGITSAAALTVSTTMRGDTFERSERNGVIGVQVAISTLSAIAVLPVGGFLGDIYWRLPFLIYLSSLPLALLTFVAFKGELMGISTKPKISSASAQPERFSVPVGLMLLGFIAGTMCTVPSTYIPFAIRNLDVTSSTMIAGALMIPAGISGVISSTFGYVRKRISWQTAFAISFGVAGIGTGIISIATSFEQVLCGLVVKGFGIGWLASNTMARATETATDATRGRFVGLVKGAFFSAAFLAVLLLEPIVRVSGPKGALVAVTVLSLVTALTFIASFVMRSNAPVGEQHR